jgi:hypothetical protein
VIPARTETRVGLSGLRNSSADEVSPAKSEAVPPAAEITVKKTEEVKIEIAVTRID